MKLNPTKNYLKMFGGMLLLGFLLSCAQGPTNLTEEISEANNAFMDAFNAHDAKALASVYTSDGILLPPNYEKLEGTEAIEGFFESIFEMGVDHASLETIYAEGHGDSAYEEGKFLLYSADDDVLDQGKYIVIWKKVDGTWKLHIDMWNSSMPLPEPVAPEESEEAISE
jgi:uncharacterized protein (TIGR02246 family)